jgi:hypothetical protein
MVITFITFVPFHSDLRVLADQERINVSLWHLATTAGQTRCPLLVKADAASYEASVGQSIKPCLAVVQPLRLA